MGVPYLADDEPAETTTDVEPRTEDLPAEPSEPPDHEAVDGAATAAAPRPIHDPASFERL
jgi:hypothetical protein